VLQKPEEKEEEKDKSRQRIKTSKDDGTKEKIEAGNH
jgi:hypothetical protein